MVVHKTGGSLRIVEEYDPATDTWTKKTDMPTPRSSIATAVVNGKIYVIGGWDGGRPVSTVEEYDPLANRWKKKADMLTPRGGVSTSVVNGKIYAIGGSKNQGVFAGVEGNEMGVRDVLGKLF